VLDSQLRAVCGLRTLTRLKLARLDDQQLARLVAQGPVPPLEESGEGLALTAENCADFRALAPALKVLSVGGLPCGPPPPLQVLGQFVALGLLSLSGVPYGGPTFVSVVGACKRLCSPCPVAERLRDAAAAGRRAQ